MLYTKFTLLWISIMYVKVEYFCPQCGARRSSKIFGTWHVSHECQVTIQTVILINPSLYQSVHIHTTLPHTLRVSPICTYQFYLPTCFALLSSVVHYFTIFVNEF
jgi:hypothetical protein